jgi:hypothetical protein
MESLRRPVVYCGVTYPQYEMDFYTSNVYGKMYKDKDRALKPSCNRENYLKYCFCIGYSQFTAEQHRLFAETFPDLISKSPLVSHYGLQIGNDRHELKTPMGFTFICNLVCPDHIDNNRSNNHHTNLMLVTQSENMLKCGPYKGKKYKSVRKTPENTYRVDIRWPNILDKNGKEFYISKNFKIQEEAVSGYNTMLEEVLLTVWGSDLGPKMYDFAYKNVIETPVQEQLILR